VQFGIVYGSDDDTELGWGEVRWYKYIKQSAQDPTEDPFSCWKTRRKRWAGDEGARRLPPARIKEQASSIPRSAEPENEFCLQSARDNSGKHHRRERTKKNRFRRDLLCGECVRNRGPGKPIRSQPPRDLTAKTASLPKDLIPF
jgi:hypothetical protein